MGSTFEGVEDLKTVYLNNAFKHITSDTAKSFFACIGKASELSSSPEVGGSRFLSPSMRKCFPYNTSIDFTEAENKENLWDLQARELWQTGYTQW